MDSKTIYQNLCNSRKYLKESYCRHSGLHKHHILPKHSGGLDIDDNYTYLTPKEHVIAHYLLWRIYKNPNDLRSMYILKGSVHRFHHKIIGEFCRDNNIGFFNSKYSDKRSEWGTKGATSQIKNKIGIHNPENFSYHASLGGKAGAAAQIKNKQGIHTDNLEQRSKWASLGGQAHKGKRCMYKPDDTTFKRVKPEDINSFLEKGYVFGSPYKGKNQYTK